MKKLITSLIVSTAALAFSAPLASAEPTPTPSATSIPPIGQFRVDRDAFMADMRARNLQINLINGAFSRACDKAKQDFKRAMATSKTPDQKNAAVATRDASITAAIVARDNAIKLLGPEPTPTADPTRLGKVQSKSKQR